MLLITQGKDGVLAYRRKDASLIQHPAPKVTAVDTTGAGDAFVAGLLTGLARNWPVDSQEAWHRLLRQATACGALATTARGAMTALPDVGELARFCAQPY